MGMSKVVVVDEVAGFTLISGEIKCKSRCRPRCIRDIR